MTPSEADRFEAWLAALRTRHLADRTVTEVGRGVRALSSLYVERRGRIASGAALDGSGKRSAFALFYAVLHYLVVSRVVREIEAGEPAPTTIVDLGCGTGVAGAAWCMVAGGRSRVLAVDSHPWAVEEARWNLARLGLRGRVVRRDLNGVRLPARNGAAVAAFTVNEIADADRERLLAKLLRASAAGARVLVLESVARRAAPWWPEWSTAFLGAGGRDDSWRFREDLPETLRLLDRSSGLDHRELKARSLYLDGSCTVTTGDV